MREAEGGQSGTPVPAASYNMFCGLYPLSLFCRAKKDSSPCNKGSRFGAIFKFWGNRWILQLLIDSTAIREKREIARFTVLPRHIQREKNRWISRIMEAANTLTVPCVRRCGGCEPESRKARFFNFYSILSVINSCILVTPLSTKLLHELNRVTMPFFPASLRRISRFFSLTTTLRIFSFIYIIS